jgi:predicted RNA-binding protein YlxR (DUF448 family)
VVCRTVRAKRDLVRVVRTPDARLVIDETGRLPGRGAYLCRIGDCIQIGIDKDALGRALTVPTPASLREELAAIMSTPQGGARGQE